MSSRRSSRQQSDSSRITEDQIIHLISKLQQVLPTNELGHNRRRSEKISAPKVLQDTCNHVRTLHREVDDLSERLSQVLATLDADSAEAAMIRSLLM